jgi:hydrogenase maturation protease
MSLNKPIILGLGNPLFQDEGLGIHIIHQLMREPIKERAELIDGGTDGLTLLGVVEDAEQLLVIDAVDGGYPPGTIKMMSNNDIPQLCNTYISEHQLGFQEVLALARLRGNLPSQMVLIGVQPQSLDWGTELTEPVTSSLPRIREMVYEQIETWFKTSN